MYRTKRIEKQNAGGEPGHTLHHVFKRVGVPFLAHRSENFVSPQWNKIPSAVKILFHRGEIDFSLRWNFRRSKGQFSENKNAA